MSKPRTLFALAAASSLALAGATVAARGPSGSDRDGLDNGTPITADWRGTGAFSSLSAVGPDNVRFETGSTARVRAEGDPRALERLRFVVRDGRLIVGRKRSEYTRDNFPPATITVTAPAIRGATAAGSGRLSVDRLSGDDVFVAVAGSGDMAVQTLEAHDLSAKVAGSGSLMLAGRSRSAAMAIAGSGRIEGRGFTTGSATTMIAGSGDAEFRSGGNVNVSITGSGSVTVTGGATCTLRKIGSGTLRCG